MASLNVIRKPFSRAEGCLTSVPRTLITTVSTVKTPHSLLSLPPKPIRLFHLSSSSSSSWVSLKTRTSRTALVPLVAQTSDWARQDEEEEEQEGGFSWDSEGGQEIEASGSEGAWEGDVEEFGEGNEGSEYTFSEPPEEAKLFVGNLAYDVDHDKLAELFNGAGVVEIAEVIYNRETGRSRGFGFITMNTVEEAEKAIEMFNRYELNGRYLTVNKAAPRGSLPERPRRKFEPSFRIYVGNLPWQVDDARLEQVFSEYGKVVDARVVYDHDTQRSRGFGFVTMSSETEVNDAIAALDGQSLDGRAIKVNVAEDQRRGSF